MEIERRPRVDHQTLAPVPARGRLAGIGGFGLVRYPRNPPALAGIGYDGVGTKLSSHSLGCHTIRWASSGRDSVKDVG